MARGPIQADESGGRISRVPAITAARCGAPAKQNPDWQMVADIEGDLEAKVDHAANSASAWGRTGDAAD